MHENRGGTTRETSTFWSRSGRLIQLLLGMSGLRLDRRGRTKRFVAWTAGWLASYALFQAVFSFHGLIAPGPSLQIGAWVYAALIWVLYYGVFLGITLGMRWRGLKTLTSRSEEGYGLYEVLLGIVFLNQGLCQVAVMKAHANTLPVEFPREILWALGGAMMALGLFWKAWATRVAGMDTYYYRDMFMDRATLDGKAEPWVRTGPYRCTANPMYGLGNLQAYGAAVWYGSMPGLAVAFLFQASIYGFYFLFERPFIRRVYDAHCTLPCGAVGSSILAPKLSKNKRGIR